MQNTTHITHYIMCYVIHNTIQSLIIMISPVEEFMTICKNLTDEQVRVAFEKFDTSGDERLDYREFCEMINKRQEEQTE